MPATRRHALAALAALAVTGAVTATEGASAGATTKPAWARTATRAVDYTHGKLAGHELGKLPSAHRLHLAIALTPPHARREAAAVKAIYRQGSGSYHHYLTPAQWRRSYAPSEATAAAVRSYLRAEGFTGIHTAGDRLLITATATAGRAERAFHTSIARFALGHRQVYGNTSAAEVPARLGHAVTAVIGLNNLPVPLIKPKQTKPSATGSPDFEGGLYPAQFKKTYNATGTPDGGKTAIAILTEGKTKGVIASLRRAERKENLPKVPVTVVPVGNQSKDNSGADEFDMDSQVSTGVAGNVAHLYMYSIGSLVDAQIDADFAKFVSDDKAQALSASIGGCEYNSWLDGSEVATDNVMQEAAAQGQSLFASSGDNGDACMYVAAIGAPVGPPGVNWPASGEFTTAVGGTSLVTDSKGNRIQEEGWLGSGGGYSTVENPGWWTEHTDFAYPTQYATGGRAVPDIALDADPNLATPCKVYVGKTLSYVGGTSLSSPMMLGFWSRLESAHGNALGLASIPLYQRYFTVNPGTKVKDPAGVPIVVPNPDPKAVKGFTDITVGTNGTYLNRPGWDEVTGLGAPDVKALDKKLK
jgi:subtilase family serine protease